MIGYLSQNYSLIHAFQPVRRTRTESLAASRIFKMAPLHHHFELLGWSESKVIARFWILALIFALLALTTLKLR